MKCVPLLVLLSLAACGTDRAAFRPTDNVAAQGHGGQPAAAYDIRRAPGEDPHVHINVWSRGAYADGDQTIVRMSVEVRNTGNEPVTLEPGALQLEAYRNSGAPLPAPQLVQTMAPGGILTVPPGEAATFQLAFAIQPSIDPDSIGGLRLRWALQHDDGRRYVQFTDFQRVPEPTYVATGFVYYDPIFGVYDPFFYGPPYGYHLRHQYPVRRVIIEHRDRGPREARRARAR
jgi:hypothetical protein